MKTSAFKRKPTTHFEQVPLEVVKKIVDSEAAERARAELHDVIVEPSSQKTEPYSIPARAR